MFLRVIVRAGDLFDGLLGVGSTLNPARSAHAQHVQRLPCHHYAHMCSDVSRR